MKTFISRHLELQRKRRLIECIEHEYSQDTIQDPADKRKKLRGGTVIMTGSNKEYKIAHCVNCGTGKLTD